MSDWWKFKPSCAVTVGNVDVGDINVETVSREVICVDYDDTAVVDGPVIGCFVRAVLRTIDENGAITNTPIGDFEDCSMTTPYTPTIAVKKCSDTLEAADTYVHHQCMLDDVNGDGSLYAPYVDATLVTSTEAGSTATRIGSFTDESHATPYAPTNPVAAESVGTEARLIARVYRLDGAGTFSFPANAVSVGFTVTNYNGVPILLDDESSVTEIRETGFVLINEANSPTANGLYGNTITVTTNAGDSVIFTWNELG